MAEEALRVWVVHEYIALWPRLTLFTYPSRRLGSYLKINSMPWFDWLSLSLHVAVSTRWLRRQIMREALISHIAARVTKAEAEWAEQLGNGRPSAGIRKALRLTRQLQSGHQPDLWTNADLAELLAHRLREEARSA